MHELERLLPTLEPPPGGFARLQRRVAIRQPGWTWPPRWAWAATSAIIAVAVVSVVWLPSWVAQQKQAAVFTSENGIRVVDGAAIELPSGQSNVRLYLVQSIPPAEAISKLP